MDENMSVSYDKQEHRFVAQIGDEIYYCYDGINWILKEKENKNADINQ